MAETLLEQAPQYRLTIFIALFALFCFLETVFNRRKLNYPRAQRWRHNLGFLVIDAVFLRVVFPLGALGAATIAANYELGVFPILAELIGLETTALPMIVLGLILMDMAIYWQHRLMHVVPFLWRLHRLHHMDRDLDVSSASRFHPLEIGLSMGLKYLLIFALGLPVITVFLFEVLLNSLAMFNHSNLRLPDWIDRWLKKIVVTPDMHRVHHSVIEKETNSNYGFCLSLWDHLFASYTHKNYSEQAEITLGLNEFNKDSEHNFLKLLKNPFLSR